MSHRAVTLLLVCGMSVASAFAQQGTTSSTKPVVDPSATSAPAAPDRATGAIKEQRIRISGGVAQGNLLHRANLAYPDDAKMRRITGTVVVRTVVGTDGLVKECEAMSGPKELRAAATDSVRKWVYRPYLLNGKIVAFETTVTVNFDMAR